MGVISDPDSQDMISDGFDYKAIFVDVDLHNAFE